MMACRGACLQLLIVLFTRAVKKLSKKACFIYLVRQKKQISEIAKISDSSCASRKECPTATFFNCEDRNLHLAINRSEVCAWKEDLNASRKSQKV